MTAVDFIVPGDIETLTGGYIYDRRVVDGLTGRGWTTTVHSLDTSFPAPTGSALDEARGLVASIPDGRLVVVDGLALGGSASILRRAADRLRLCALVHHPLALETGLDVEEAAALKVAESEALAAVRHVIVTSRWTRRALGDHGVAAERITVVEPGVDAAPPRRPASGATLRLLCVATLTPRKGHAILFDALGQLADRDWQLVCAGSLTRDAGHAAALRAQIERLGLCDRIALLGELAPDELAGRYANCDLFVLASALEGYGMVLTEALARGIPIVATAAGAIPDTVTPGAGILVPPDDSAALRRALASVMDDRGLLCRLSEAAHAGRTTLPTWQRTVDRFAATLTRLGRT